MSPQVYASPEDLERFAQQLKQFNTQLRDTTASLNGQFNRLGDTWRDQEHAKFAQEYEQTMRVLQQFIRSADQQIPFLQRKAQRLREFLNQR
ncbi:MAG: WXG100 family type VII secretion target [Caldilineaceae bacterium]|nr:WXG100 family type VII secretion target [Caldilineaceae bacterium]